MGDSPQPWVSMNDIFAAEEAKLRQARENRENQPENRAEPQRIAARGTEGDSAPLSLSVPPKILHLKSAAPAKDFNKRANSLERDALPAGLFPGTSKNVYDALYVRTRGAIQASRKIRATKKEIAEWSGVVNRKTLDSHMRYLTGSRLLQRTWELGSNEGYEYEVFLPEEVGISLKNPPPLSPSVPLSPSAQKRDRGSDQKRDRGGQRQVYSKSTTYESPKTIKTFSTIDDDRDAPFSGLNQLLADAVRELTGKPPTAEDVEQWRQVGEELVSELKRAAKNAKGVSSPPAFLAAHLKRRFAQNPLPASKNDRTGTRRDAVGKQAEPVASSGSERLSSEEVRERATLFIELLQGGEYTTASLTEQFAGSAQPEDWQAIMALVEANRRREDEAPVA